MGFSQALSGLNASSGNLNVISNNIANSQTVGFKSSTTRFADIYAAGSRVGMGVKTAGVVQNFTNGTPETTGRALDLAISGNGFFTFQQNGQTVYSRNGQLSLTPDGYLENSQGAQLLGASGAPVKIPSTAMTASATTAVGATLNLNANASNTDTVTLKDATGADVSVDYAYANTATVYDSQGNAHTLTMYFAKNGTNQWQVQTSLDGTLSTIKTTAITSTGAGTPTYSPAIETLTFDENGSPTGAVGPSTAPMPGDSIPVTTSGSTFSPFSFQLPSTADSVTVSITDTSTTPPTVVGTETLTPPLSAGVYDYTPSTTPSGTGPYTATVTAAFKGASLSSTTGNRFNFPMTNGAADINFNLDLSGATQFGNAFEMTTLTQNGYTSGSLVGFTIDQNGNIIGNYSNDQTRSLDRIQLANFRSPEGLQPIGDNAWTATSASGLPLLGTAGVGQFGAIETGMTEASNVDLTKEQVNLIVAQRTFQANSQSVKAQSEVLQQAVNLGN